MKKRAPSYSPFEIYLQCALREAKRETPSAPDHEVKRDGQSRICVASERTVVRSGIVRHVAVSTPVRDVQHRTASERESILHQNVGEIPWCRNAANCKSHRDNARALSIKPSRKFRGVAIQRTVTRSGALAGTGETGKAFHMDDQGRKFDIFPFENHLFCASVK